MQSIGGGSLPLHDLSRDSGERILLPPWIARNAHQRRADFFFGRYAAKLAIRAVGGLVGDVLIGAARGVVHFGEITETTLFTSFVW